MKTFKQKFSFDKRHKEAKRITQKYPERIPVVVEKAKHSNVPDIDKHKYLVPCDLTIGQFVYVLRKRLILAPDQALFLFVNNTIPPTSELLSSVYKYNRDKDLFLYITYSGENCFG